MATQHEQYKISFGNVDLIHSPSGATVWLNGAYVGVLYKFPPHDGWGFPRSPHNTYANARQAAYDLIAEWDRRK
jgi:hypothetical protein